MSPPLHIMLVAGEPSGDLLGAQLMQQLGRLAGTVKFSGVGGAAMEREGLKSLFPIADIALIGLAAILPRLPKIFARIRDVADLAVTTKPDAVVLIDSPEFNHRVAWRLKGMAPNIPIVIYVAPQLWASRPGRLRHLARHVDHVLALLPFEPPLFESAGIRATAVGHPVIERFPGPGGAASFRARHHIASDAPVIAVLPGSRVSEVRRLLPVFRDAVGILAAQYPSLVVVMPTVETVAARVHESVSGWKQHPIVLEDPHEKFAAFEASSIALAASGTVVLELALTRTPTIVGYRGDPLTAWLARRIVTVKWLNLVNLICNEAALPELIQEACTAENIAREAERLMSDEQVRARQKAAMTRAIEALGADGDPPSLRAARAVLASLPQPRLSTGT